jgi:predicted aminopeptidase
VTYSKTFCVLWRGRYSRLYLMNSALTVARRMRARGHDVSVINIPLRCIKR